MISWLAALPHQIPFRAASQARKVDDETIEGAYFCSSSDALVRPQDPPPASLIVEAMAQLAGSLVFTEPGTHGYLSAIDDFTLDGPVVPGDRVDLRVKLDASFGGIWRFSGTAAVDGTERGRARFYLAAPK